MFSHCISLRKAPEMNVIMISDYTYQSMFNGCISLNSKPDLISAIIKDPSYFSLFDESADLVPMYACVREDWPKY